MCWALPGWEREPLQGCSFNTKYFHTQTALVVRTFGLLEVLEIKTTRNNNIVWNSYTAWMQYERLGLYVKDGQTPSMIRIVRPSRRFWRKFSTANELAWYFRCHFVSKYSWALLYITSAKLGNWARPLEWQTGYWNKVSKIWTQTCLRFEVYCTSIILVEEIIGVILERGWWTSAPCCK